MHNFIKVFDAPITFKVYDESLQELPDTGWPWVLTADGKLGFVIEGEGLELVANPKGWLKHTVKVKYYINIIFNRSK